MFLDQPLPERSYLRLKRGDLRGFCHGIRLHGAGPGLERGNLGLTGPVRRIARPEVASSRWWPGGPRWAGDPRAVQSAIVNETVMKNESNRVRQSERSR